MKGDAGPQIIKLKVTHPFLSEHEDFLIQGCSCRSHSSPSMQGNLWKRECNHEGNLWRRECNHEGNLWRREFNYEGCFFVIRALMVRLY